MTYFSFLLRFLVIPIIIFIVITYWDHKKNRQVHGFRNGRFVWAAIGVHILLAVVYTTPWDNYLVATGVWYYNPELVTGLVIGYVPIEEYTFFVLETILSGLWWWFLARRISPAPSPSSGFTKNKLLIYLSASLLALLWLVFTYLFFFGEAQWTYLSIILFWALPPIFIQILFGADILWHYRKLVFWSIFVPGLYLSLMDILALTETTWLISPSQTPGILFFGILPLEEVLFFFITNVLITFGITLLLAHVSQERLAGLKGQVQAWKERGMLRPRSR
ncbi:MAG TPA: lycopene cyclase domain-containing protein [Anaerolineales bacterium]|nr:lycopene cyclase domain-containing protein [Anaerolineales bacterium]